MKFGRRLFLAYFAVIGLGMGLLLNSAQKELRPAVRQASEEALVDAANMLAELAVPAIQAGFEADSPFVLAINRYLERRLNAQIWSLLKTEPDFAVYVTDLKGKVVYHSDAKEIGADYSTWRDVALTLKGEYGARTSGADPSREALSTMYVAAPVYSKGLLAGVLTVSQPNEGVVPFLNKANKNLRQSGLLVLLGALLIGFLLSVWLSRSIHRLLDYVERVGRGEKVAPPYISEKALNALALATEKMRHEIDGKEYVEEYIHTLTHELKSPLSAISGATELLQDGNLPAEQQAHFLNNIATQSQRLQSLIEQLLSLASLEKRADLETAERLDLNQLLKIAADDKAPQLRQKNINLSWELHTSSCEVYAEAFLLQQAMSNLLDNAIDFCPQGGSITVSSRRTAEGVDFSIWNEGEAIPDYAQPRLFERFYSLARPTTGKKSSGLGLSFVQQVLQLHKGDIRISNAESGVLVEVLLPPLSS